MEFKLTFASGSRGSLVGSALKSKGLLITVLFLFAFAVLSSNQEYRWVMADYQGNQSKFQGSSSTPSCYMPLESEKIRREEPLSSHAELTFVYRLQWSARFIVVMAALAWDPTSVIARQDMGEHSARKVIIYQFRNTYLSLAEFKTIRNKLLNFNHRSAFQWQFLKMSHWRNTASIF